MNSKTKYVMGDYDDLLLKLYQQSLVEQKRDDRTGVKTFSSFGERMEFNLQEGFPITTRKYVSQKSVFAELLWFISGSTHIKDLHKFKCHIWDEWGTAEQTAKFGRKEGDFGPIYGHQWRNFGATKDENGDYRKDGFDQLQAALDLIKNDPTSRRIIVSGWNPNEALDVTLPPCHTLFQFYVDPTTKMLSTCLYSRSLDMFLGAPYNIAAYAALTALMAKFAGLSPGKLIHMVGDAHIYSNHLTQIDKYIRNLDYSAPVLGIDRDVHSFDDLTDPEQLMVINYNHSGKIPAPVAV